MTDKILNFPSAESVPENPLQWERDQAYCQHDQVTLDEHSRMINCRKCGATLEPFNFLVTNALTIQSAWSSYRQVMAKVKETHDRIDVLTKELKRLQGRVRTLQRKESDAGGVLELRGKSTL